MKNLLLAAFLLLNSSIVLAKNTVQNGDTTIYINGEDAWGEHGFLVNIYIKNNKAKINYAFQDSIRLAAVQKDADYQRAYANANTYTSGDPKYKLAWDTVTTLFEKHSIYTRSSKKINLNTDTAYRNLLGRVIKADTDELSPDINKNAKITGQFIIIADGNSFHMTIVTPSGKRTISANAPQMKSQPLLTGFFKSTLDKKRNSSAVKKISKWHVH